MLSLKRFFPFNDIFKGPSQHMWRFFFSFSPQGGSYLHQFVIFIIWVGSFLKSTKFWPILLSFVKFYCFWLFNPSVSLLNTSRDHICINLSFFLSIHIIQVWFIFEIINFCCFNFSALDCVNLPLRFFSYDVMLVFIYK